jgi:peroxiredoxin
MNQAAMRGRQRLAVVVTVVAAALLFWRFAGAVSDGIGWKRNSDWAVVAPNFEARDQGQAKIVPDFELTDRYGNPIKLSQFSSADLILINLWSSGCPACKREIPSLSEMDRRLDNLGRVVLLTITIDEKWEDVSHYFPQGTDLRVLFDPDNKVVKGIFGTEKFPETFILDKSRRIRARFDGERAWHTDVMFNYISSFQ